MGIAAFRVLGLPYRSFWGWLARGSMLSALVVAAMLGAEWIASPTWLPIFRLVLDGVVVALVLGTSLAIFPHAMGRDAAALLIRFVPNLEKWLRYKAYSNA